MMMAETQGKLCMRRLRALRLIVAHIGFDMLPTNMSQFAAVAIGRPLGEELRERLRR